MLSPSGSSLEWGCLRVPEGPGFALRWRIFAGLSLLPPLFLFPPHNTQESKVRRHVTDEETEAERYLFSAQPVPCLWCPGHPAQAGSPQLPLPDTHQLHYLGTPEPFLHYLGLKGKMGAREDV